MARNEVHDAVARDPRMMPHVYEGRHDRCRHVFEPADVIGWRTCSRHGTWLIRFAGSDGKHLLRCTQHAHQWLQAHPL